MLYEVVAPFVDIEPTCVAAFAVHKIAELRARRGNGNIYSAITKLLPVPM